MKKIKMTLLSLTAIISGGSAFLIVSSPPANNANEQLLKLEQEQASVFKYDLNWNEKVIATEMGRNHSGAIVQDNYGKQYLYMWGDNTQGQLGIGQTSNYVYSPMKVYLPESKIKQLVLGGRHSAAITIDANGQEHLYTWGYNRYGQIGNGTAYNNVLKPTEVDFSHTYIGSDYRIKELALGENNTGVILTDRYNQDFLYVWGNNTFGQTTNLNTLFDNRPQLINLKSVTQLKGLSFGYDHVGIIGTNEYNYDQLYMWGSDSKGQLGNFADGISFAPVPIYLPSGNIKELSLGSYYTGAVIERYGLDVLYMWGDNFYGQLGTGNSTSYDQPQKIKEFNNVQELSLGLNHSGLIDNVNGQNNIYTWGRNDYGQLGYYTFEANPQRSPKAISISNNKIQDISLGGLHSAALVTDAANNINHLYGWGANNKYQVLPRYGVSKIDRPLKVM